MRKGYVIKKSLALCITVLILILQVTVTFADSNFTDVSQGKWYYNDVLEAQKAGFVSGIGGGKFSPDTTITYAEYLAVLDRIIDISVDKIESTGKWYDRYITFAKQKGILDTTEVINPTLGIPRQDMFKYTCKALGISPDTSGKQIFGDVPVGATIEGYCNASYNEYLCEGTGSMPDGSLKFSWGETATRSELAAMALRTRDYKADPIGFKAKKAATRDKFKISQSDIDDGAVSVEKSRAICEEVLKNVKINADKTVTLTVPDILPTGWKWEICVDCEEVSGDGYTVIDGSNIVIGKPVTSKLYTSAINIKDYIIGIDFYNGYGGNNINYITSGVTIAKYLTTGETKIYDVKNQKWIQ